MYIRLLAVATNLDKDELEREIDALFVWAGLAYKPWLKVMLAVLV